MGAENDSPILRLDVELESLHTAVKDTGDEVYMLEYVEKGRDIFDHMLDHELSSIHDAHEMLDLLYTHVTTATPYCRDGKLYDYDKGVHQFWDILDETWKDVRITPDYISTVFGETDAGYDMKALLSAMRVYDSDEVRETDDSFEEACQWLHACEFGVDPLTPEQIDAELPLTSYTNRVQNSCIAYIQELYTYYDDLQSIAADLHVYQGLDNYYNHQTGNDGDNLSFDVRQGFESVGNLLSSYLGELDVLDFYPSDINDEKLVDAQDTDQALINIQGSDPFETGEGEDETIFDLSKEDRVNMYNPTKGVPKKQIPTEKTANYSSSGPSNIGGGLARVGPEPGGGDSLTNSRSLALPKTGPLSSLVQQSITISDPSGGIAVIQPDMCSEEIIEVQEIPADVFQESIIVREQKKQYTKDLDTTERVSKVLRNPKNFDKEEKKTKTFYDLPALERGEILSELEDYLETQVRIDTGSGDLDPDDLLEDIDEGVRGCIEEYTEEDPAGGRQQAKKALLTTPPLLECIQKLLCKEFTDSSGLGLVTARICTIPAQAVKQNNVQQVSSLHEVLSAHLNIAVTMQNSGALMRHVKTKEFLAFKTLKLDFSKMFAFSINTSSKAPKVTRNPKVDAMETKETQEDLAQVILGTPAHKYDQTGLDNTMFLYSPLLDKVQSKTALTSESRNANIQNTQEFIDALQPDSTIVSRDYYQQLLAEKQLYTVEYLDMMNTYFLPSVADEIEDIRNTFNKKYDELK